LGQLKSSAFPMLAMAAGALLILLAVPRTIAAFASLLGDPVADALQYGKTQPTDQLDALRSGRIFARRFVDSGRLDTDTALADLSFLEAGNVGRPTRAWLLAESIVLLRRGLSMAPANGFAWARLAYALTLSGGEAKEALAAWRMSIMTVPVDERLALWRVALGLQLRPSFAPDDGPLLDRQIRWAWRYSQDQLARLAVERDSVPLVRAALASDPVQLQQLDALIKH
jgi:hypothetical protein